MENSTKKILCYFVLITCHLFGTINLASAHFMWQEAVVIGQVTSSIDGTPLPGVNIVVKGTSRGTTTDIDGSTEWMFLKMKHWFSVLLALKLRK